VVRKYVKEHEELIKNFRPECVQKYVYPHSTSSSEG